jgi:hypothetical protein
MIRALMLQLHNPVEVDHHTDNQYLYRHLRQSPVVRLSKSVTLLHRNPALDGRTLVPTIRISSSQYLQAKATYGDIPPHTVAPAGATAEIHLRNEYVICSCV